MAALWKRMLLVGGLVAVVALAAIDVHATYGARISVDEPQYLLTAISVGEDFDLDISDELDEQRYRPFHESELLQQTVELDESGQRLSPHDPLFPILLALPMRLGGWVGTRVFMALLTGVAAALTLFLAERRFRVSAPTATGVVAACFISPPLIAYGNQVYPAMPAAICVLVALVAIMGETRRLWWVGVLAVVALPWLAVKYVPLAAVLAGGLLCNVRRNQRELVITVVSLVVCGVVYLVVHRQVYGGWTVYAAGDHFVDGEWQVIGTKINIGGRTRRLVGLFVDRGFGLAAWAPAFLAAPAALTWMARTKRTGWHLLVVLVVVGWAVATWVALTMHGWWWPGRQVVPVVPLMVIALAAAVDGSRTRLIALLTASAVAIFSWLWLVVEASTDRLTLIVDFRDTTNPLYRAWKYVLPDHQRFELDNPALTILWTVALVASCWAVWAKGRDTVESST